MASPRRRRARKLAAMRAAAPEVSTPTPADVVGENGSTKPVVLEMAPEEDIVVTVDYDAMTKAELQELCDAKGVSYGRMTPKASLIRLLKHA
jgi:hypothetical protein